MEPNVQSEPTPSPTHQTPQPPAATAEARPVVHLSVLPHSGKVEELRRQMQADRDTSPAAAGSTPEPTTSAAVTAPADISAASPTEGAATTAGDSPARSIQQKLLQAKVIEVLRQIYDPEIPVNIYDLGLIYEVNVGEDNAVKVKMTLTAPACPVAGTLPGEVETRIENIPEVKSADVELVWDPPWSRDRMSEAAQLELGFF